MGLGKAWSSSDKVWLLYALAGPDLGYAATGDNRWHGGAKLLTGAVYQPDHRFKLLLRSELARYYQPAHMDRFDTQVQAVLSVSRNRDLRAHLARRSGMTEALLGMRQYF